jgi:hypothetical protein
MHSVKDKSAFAQAALELDTCFEELERLSGQLERCELDSDQDFEHATKLLGRFGECGQRIGTGVQKLAQELERARARAENAAKVVGERSVLVQQRQEASRKMLDRFGELALRARGVTESLRDLKDKDRSALVDRLPALNVDLESLSKDVSELEEEALAQGLKALAKNAGSMRQSLQAARDRLRAS